MINLQREAIENSKARQVRGSLKARTAISTRDARAHLMLRDLQPGESIHLASMGELSLHDVAAAVAEHYGPFECLTLATWAASEESIKRLIDLRQAGSVRRLEALVDSRMPTDCADAHAMMAATFDLYRPGSNHAKVMAFTGGPYSFPSGERGIAVISTANLTHNPRCEVLCVNHSSVLAEFHRDWIREVLNAS